MHKAYLGLGTNLGEREENLRRAVKLLNASSRLEIIKVSSLYETEPWGYEEQNDFLNLCLTLETSLSPHQLLEKCQTVEEKLGRKRKERWGPRVIDVDILLYDDLELEDSDLIVPHPRMQERAFVLIPLQELEPDLMVQGNSIADYLEKVSTAGVNYYSDY
ncbi:MAG: 2-amino-4-hydroxy-6-hydroxymethyldihydropteridine diphosphokinase [Halanaerobacter sp.]